MTSDWDEKFEERRAWAILGRLHWLANAGCNFSFNLDEVTKSLRKAAPDWKPEYGAKAAASLEGKSGTVKTETNYEALLDTPLSSLISQAKELSGRSEDFLVEKNPFAGLVAERPVRALSALTLAAKQGTFPDWAWRQFLNSEARKKDKARLANLIALRLASYSISKLANIIGPASDWLHYSSSILATHYVDSFDVITEKLIVVLRKRPGQGRSSILRSNQATDWATEALNSPTGRIAQAMFNDPRKNNLNAGQKFPSSWLKHIDALLALPDDLHRNAFTILFFNLNWFHLIDPSWTEAKLLPALDGDDVQDRDAAWSGFLWGARTPHRALYMRLKKHLLTLAINPLPSRRSYDGIIADMILAGWGSDDETGERCISSDEMHTLLLNGDDEFRTRVLRQAERWAGGHNENSRERWLNLLPALLRIWPRQISAKSPSTSARLCELAFSSGDQFPILAELVLPLLTKIERDHLMLPNLTKSRDSIVDRYPVQILAILHAILPDNALAWPYGIEAILHHMGEADSALNADERLIALKRKWDAR